MVNSSSSAINTHPPRQTFCTYTSEVQLGDITPSEATPHLAESLPPCQSGDIWYCDFLIDEAQVQNQAGESLTEGP